MWIAAAVFGWLESLAFVSHVSMAALFLTGLDMRISGEAAVRAEEASDG